MLRPLVCVALLSLIGIGCVGCGGSAPSTKTPSPAATNSSVGAANPSGRRTASPTLISHWPFASTPRVAIYIDLDGWLRTDLGTSFVPAALAFAEEARGCVETVLRTTKEAALGMTRDENAVALVRIAPGANNVLSNCIQHSKKAAKTEVAGADEAYSLGNDGLAVRQRDLLIFGDKALVIGALAEPKAKKNSLSELSLDPDQYATWQADDGEGASMQGGFWTSRERLRAEVVVDLPKEEYAKLGEEQFAKFRSEAQGPNSEERAQLEKLLAPVTLTRRGKQLTAVVEVREPPEGQARFVGAASAVTIVALKKYRARAKIAEAQSMIGQIMNGIRTRWESDPPAKRKLVSFPPVPATIPKGTKYESSASDWKAWDAIHIRMETPQYYQYEVRASKDGKKAEIIARGDLDGDGQASLFKAVIVVDDKKELQLDRSAFVETDPEE